MQREEFLRRVSKHLYPALRVKGFRGSGATLRRTNGPVLHIFNLQGGSAGNEFFVNLGATLTSLEMQGVTTDTSATAKEYQCVFRLRLDPPDRPRTSWPYPVSDTEAEQTVQDLTSQYARIGEPWLNRYGSWPEAFASVVESEGTSHAHPAHMLVLARIALLLGASQRAEFLARQALDRCPASASGLRFDLERLVTAACAA